ncbi:MAG TPA: EF-hand domain-containing protein [Gemmataceae bacterium]|nr:EF-hand domain-containing protein [Gemmataceae bacterium]
MRVLHGSIALWALLAVGFAVAQEQGAAPATQKKTAAPGKPLQFDLDGFLKDHDKNGDGFLQRDELPPAYRAAFDRVDTNKDGKISREELAQGVAHLRPRRRPSDVIYMLVEMSEDDQESQREVQRAYEILRRLDRNKDGKIDADELKAGREHVANNRVDFIFKQLDTNKDGRISREEAKGHILANFAEIDSNRDGFIDRAELLKAAMEKPTAAPSGGERRTTPPPQPGER